MKMRHFLCPIYPARIIIVQDSAERIMKSRSRYNHILGEQGIPIKAGMYCGNRNLGYFGLFFTDEHATDDVTVSHEVFHLTHGIMYANGCDYDYFHEEPFAQLHGVLFGKINSILRDFNKSPDKKRKARR